MAVSLAASPCCAGCSRPGVLLACKVWGSHFVILSFCHMRLVSKGRRDPHTRTFSGLNESTVPPANYSLLTFTRGRRSEEFPNLGSPAAEALGSKTFSLLCAALGRNKFTNAHVDLFWHVTGTRRIFCPPMERWVCQQSLESYLSGKRGKHAARASG